MSDEATAAAGAPGPDCIRVEEAVSALADGEGPGLSRAAVDAHLAGCGRCRSFAARVAGLKTVTAEGSGTGVPATSESIVASLPPGAAPRAPLIVAGRVIRGRALALAAAAVVVVLVGAFVGGEQLAGGGSGGTAVNGIARIQQVSGSTQASATYPGATVMPVSVRKPDLTLTDTAGQPYNLATATAGRVTLVYFGYTHCPDVCPINMALAAEALQRMPEAERAKVTVVFVTTDPVRDTPPVLRAWLDHFDPSFVGLTGTIAQIHQAETDIGMPLSFAEASGNAKTGGYEIVHAGYTLLYSQDDVAHLQVDVTEQPAQYATTLDHLVRSGFVTT